ncbi:biogenesis of lysosome-related organelles complex 1 subunit 1 [Aspergillus terreus]|uniref:Biogenesis of lysosome-related organelles complex 1 subunit 1 n=1 Tax=Aspergillus terreus TaxID=33178 RepID=A0A5M3YQZ6_ASPTE|nr:hypothetical protein ATETN484_0001043900 [Aspergillus terreus]GFF12295.1 biogenesis of lysosome-related organelles complex 1 subunit 1 [Aspergillus terreus]
MSTNSIHNSPPDNTNNIPSPQRTAEAKAAFEASLRSVGANYEADLRDRARNLHENAAALDKQEGDVQRATGALAKQNDQLAKVADQARDGLKEIGDVQNWAELIERDLLVIEETVRLAEEREEEEENKRAHHAREERRRRGTTTSADADDDDDGGVLVVNGNGAVEENRSLKDAMPPKKGWFGWW